MALHGPAGGFAAGGASGSVPPGGPRAASAGVPPPSRLPGRVAGLPNRSIPSPGRVKRALRPPRLLSVNESCDWAPWVGARTDDRLPSPPRPGPVPPNPSLGLVRSGVWTGFRVSGWLGCAWPWMIFPGPAPAAADRPFLWGPGLRAAERTWRPLFVSVASGWGPCLPPLPGAGCPMAGWPCGW